MGCPWRGTPISRKGSVQLAINTNRKWVVVIYSLIQYTTFFGKEVASARLKGSPNKPYHMLSLNLLLKQIKAYLGADDSFRGVSD